MVLFKTEVELIDDALHEALRHKWIFEWRHHVSIANQAAVEDASIGYDKLSLTITDGGCRLCILNSRVLIAWLLLGVLTTSSSVDLLSHVQ